jgi:RNA polymerase sigma-70 factor (ECF subfamily)
MQQDQLIKKVLKGNSRAQKAFYDQYAPKMYGVALRYARDRDEANDILQEGFVKVFGNLASFRNEGSLEGWVRRTIVNTAINYYKKNAKHHHPADMDVVMIFEESDVVSIVDQMSADELMEKINDLPDGYRTVFNLNVIEGYTHKEIGDMLDISENTSKSQLARAKSYLKKRIVRK